MHQHQHEHPHSRSRRAWLQGTTCEPWIARGAITLLHELLLPGTAKALEWSSGSSTVWLLLGRVRHLTSVEHHPAWAKATEKRLTSMFGKEYLKVGCRWCCRCVASLLTPWLLDLWPAPAHQLDWVKVFKGHLP